MRFQKILLYTTFYKKCYEKLGAFSYVRSWKPDEIIFLSLTFYK